MSTVRNGASVEMVSLRSHIGSGSSEHSLRGDAFTLDITSSSVGGVKTSREGPEKVVYVARPIPAVRSQMFVTLASMKLWYSTAENPDLVEGGALFPSNSSSTLHIRLESDSAD